MNLIRATAGALVAAQFACIGYLVVDGPFIAKSPAPLAAQASAIALGLWALLAMRKSRIRIGPTPARDAALIDSGPYRLIRHPMYTAVILFTAGALPAEPTTHRLLAFGALVLVLTAKIAVEEHLLRNALDGYDAYRRRTKRLVPFLF